MNLRAISRAALALSTFTLLFVGCQQSRESLATTRPAVATASTQPAADRMRETVSFLASDELEGRGVGTEGIDKAARYISSRLKAAGLQPVRAPDMEGFYQPFTMRGETRIEPQTRLAVDGSVLELNKDYRPLNFSGSRSFAGGVTFAGYAARNPAKAYDDFANVDVKGRVVLAMRYEPHDEKGKSRWSSDGWSEQGSLVTKAENAARAGAAALLLVNPANHHGDSDQLVPFSRRFSMKPLDIPVVQVTQAVANDLLARGGLPDLKTLQDQIDTAAKPASAALSQSAVVRGDVAIRTPTLHVKNVVAALPGRGRLADEWIVLGAHYDHLGMGGRGSLTGGGQRVVHNGADDNASGTAALIELAERFAKRRTSQRSLLFVFFSGEEHGLLGSEHFVNQPPVALDKVVAMVNLDMVGRIKNDDVIVGGRDTAAAFPGIVDDVDAASPLKTRPMTGMIFGSSDHASFMKKRIPVLFLFSGLHADYHRPTDDVEKINFGGMAHAADFTEAMVRRIAAAPRQEYLSRPTTRPAATRPSSTQPAAARDPNMETGRPQLGIVPSYAQEDETPDGIKVTGTTPGTAAADAGLRDGDILQSIDDRRIRTLEDLMEFLATAKVGQKITLHVIRNGQPLSVETTLKARQ